MKIDKKETQKIRVLIAKPGLDGHDKGAKVVATALRNAGMEVIYTGRRQTVAGIVNAAMQEDVDIIGLSILSGAHLEVCEDLFRLLKDNRMEDVHVVVGGIIPKGDVAKLRQMGVAEVFPVGSSFELIEKKVKEIVRNSH